MYIAVSGNIGSGKTTLVELLSKKMGIKPYFESLENPYLDDFYSDMSRWALQLQICFLTKKLEQLFAITSKNESIIQDRTIYEEAFIFVANLRDMGLLSKRDHQTYMNMFNLLVGKIPQPDVIIYLKATVPTLLGQIYKRGREYEMRIEASYLERLNKLYDNWIENIYTGEVVVVDIDNDDFVLTPKIVDNIISKIEPLLSKRNI